MLHCKSLKEIRVSTPAENRVGNSSVSKGFDQLESSFANHTHEWFWPTWSKMSSMFVNRYLRYSEHRETCLRKTKNHSSAHKLLFIELSVLGIVFQLGSCCTVSGAMKNISRKIQGGLVLCVTLSFRNNHIFLNIRICYWIQWPCLQIAHLLGRTKITVKRTEELFV